MLKLINLSVIDRIFNEDSKFKLSAKAQALYVNALIHHFRDLPAKVHNSVAFELFKSEIKGFENHKKTFEELHNAGLVIINGDNIYFNNLWGAKINREQLEKSKPEEAVAGFRFKAANDFADELYNSHTVFEVAKIKNGLEPDKTVKLIELFLKERTEADTKYQSYSNCFRDLMYYLKTNSYGIANKQKFGAGTYLANKSEIAQLDSLTNAFLTGLADQQH